MSVKRFVHKSPIVWILLAILSTTGLAVAQGSGDPAIEINPRTVLFGTMKQEDVRSQNVTIQNTGGGILVIKDVESSCGCTVAEPDKKELKAGETTEMLVTFDSQKFMGAQKKMIKITSNATNSPTIAVTVEAFVSVPIMFNPPWRSVSLGRFSQGEVVEETISVESPEVAELELTAISLGDKPFTVIISDNPAGGKASKLLTFRSRPDAPIGTFREIARFRTNVPETPTFDLDIGGKVESKVVLSPEKLNFRYLLRGQEVKRAVTVQIAKILDAKVVRAEIDVPGFKVEEINYMDSVSKYHVVISGTPIDKSAPEAIKARGRIKGNLTIFLDSDEIPSLQVPITYMLRM